MEPRVTAISRRALARFGDLAAQPILAEMQRQLLEASALQAGDTPIKVQTEDQRGTRRGFLRVWRNLRGSPRVKVPAEFKGDRSARGRDHLLGDWTGTLLTDGYDGVIQLRTKGGDPGF